MGYTSGGGSSSSSMSIPPGGKSVSQFAKGFIKEYSPYLLKGDITSPAVRFLSNLTYDQGMKEAAKQREGILSARGMSQPAKASAVKGLADKAVLAAAGVPLEMYDKLAKFMSGLMQPLTISESSTKDTSHYGL